MVPHLQTSRQNKFGPENKFFTKLQGERNIRICPECNAYYTWVYNGVWHCEKCGWSQKKEDLLKYGKEEIKKIKEGIEAGKTSKEIAAEFPESFKTSGVAAKVTEVKKRMKMYLEEEKAFPIRSQKTSGYPETIKNQMDLWDAGFVILDVDTVADTYLVKRR